MQQGKLVDIRGLQQTYRALGQVAPELRRQMLAEVGGLVKKRVDAARATMPYDRRRKGRPKGKPHMATKSSTYLTKNNSKKDVARGRKQGLFGFKAISNVPHANILDLAQQGRPALISTLNAKYGPAPRFLGRQLLPSGAGGTLMWRQSKAIVERYIGEMNKRIEANANTRMVA